MTERTKLRREFYAFSRKEFPGVELTAKRKAYIGQLVDELLRDRKKFVRRMAPNIKRLKLALGLTPMKSGPRKPPEINYGSHAK